MNAFGRVRVYVSCLFLEKITYIHIFTFADSPRIAICNWNAFAETFGFFGSHGRQSRTQEEEEEEEEEEQQQQQQQQQGQATKSRQGTLALDDKVVVGKGTKVVVAAKKTKAAKDPKSAVPGRQKGIAMSGLRRS